MLSLIQRRNEAEEPLQPQNPKALVVDDTEMNLVVVKKLMETLGVECDTASSGTQAIEKIESSEYNLVLMDHLMPDTDGVETTKILREKGYTPEKLPVVLFSANAIEDIRKEFDDAGFNDYLPKPINRASLENILKKWVSGQKLQNKQTDSAKSPTITKIAQEIEEINIEQALERVGGESSILESSLKIMMHGLPEVVEKMNSYLDGGDIQKFTIEVHGVKGSLLNIGANKPAKLAQELETNSRTPDVDFCKQNLPALNEQLLTLWEKLSKIINDQDKSTPLKEKGNAGTLKKQIKKVRQYIENFKSDEAAKLIQTMVMYTYGEDKDLFLQKLLRLTQEFQYEQAVELIIKEKI